MTKVATLKQTKEETVTIHPPNFKQAVFKIRSTAQYVANKFSQKARDKLAADMAKGDQKKKETKRSPKDFEAQYLGAMHVSEDGWYGQPCSGYRQAMISACRAVGFKMTHAKLAFSVLADGFDKEDRTALVRIIEGEPEKVRMYTRLANGMPDIVDRPVWRIWSVDLRIRFDADMFTLTDVANLLARAGLQVGIGAGRPDSKTSSGMDWGTFAIEQETSHE